MNLKRFLLIVASLALTLTLFTVGAYAAGNATEAEANAYVLTTDGAKVFYASAQDAIDDVCDGTVDGDIHLLRDEHVTFSVAGVCTLYTHGMYSEADNEEFVDGVFCRGASDPEGNDVWFYYYLNDPALFLIDGLPSNSVADFTAAKMNGKTVTLLSDMELTEAVSGVRFDLNGHSLYTAVSNVFTGNDNYIYSSLKGGAFYAANQIATTGAAVSFGYSSAGVEEGERISVYSAGMVFFDAATAYLNDVDLFLMKPYNGNYQYSFMTTWGNKQTLSFSGCKIYNLGGAFLFGGNGIRAGFDVEMRDSELYGTGGLVGTCASGASIGITLPFRFYNVQVYGISCPNREDYFGLVADEKCLFTNTTPAYVTSPEGYTLMESAIDHTVSVNYVTGGLYLGQPTTYTKSYSTAYTYVAAATGPDENTLFSYDGLYFDDLALFTAENLSGRSVVLYADLTVSEALQNVTLDLNGHALTSTASSFISGMNNYVYSSVEGGALYVSSLVAGASSGSAFAQALYVGYSASGVVAGEKLSVYVQNKLLNEGSRADIYNADVFFFNSDTKAADRAICFVTWGRPQMLNAEKCNFYNVGGAYFFGSNGASKGFTVTIKDSNIYGGAGLFAQSPATSQPAIGTSNPLKFYNVKVWGTTAPNRSDYYGLVADENCTFTNTIADAIISPEGCLLAPKTVNHTVSVSYPVGGVYGAEIATYSASFETTMAYTSLSDALFVAGGAVYTDKSYFTAENLNGRTIVLYADMEIAEALTNVTIDLNGYSLTSTASSFIGGMNNYVYSSVEGGALYVKNLVSGASSGSALAQALYVGYSASGVVSGEKLSVYVQSKLLAEGSRADIYNADVFFFNSDTKAADRAICFVTWGRPQTLNAEKCNFYNVGGAYFFGSNGASKGFTVTIKDSNIYGGAGLFAQSPSTQTPGIGTNNPLKFYNVKVYGVTAPNRGDYYGLVVDENCTFTNPVFEYMTYPDGYVLVPKTVNHTVSVSYPAGGVLGGETATYEVSFPTTYVFKKTTAVNTLLYHNLTLDANMVYNLYVPTDLGVTAVLLGQTNLLDADKTLTIAGKTYYVISVPFAPKDALTTQTLTLTMNQDVPDPTVTVGVVKYLTQLLNVEEAAKQDYLSDSKALARYVLNYVKEMILYTDALADVSVIDGLLAGFSLTENDMTVENAHAVEQNPAVESASLNLDASVGFVFEIKAGFVGTVTVSMQGLESVSRTFTEDAPAASDTYIILTAGEMFRFRNDVTVTYTGSAEGSFTYNLASYVDSKKSGVAYATYAYALHAEDYHAKYSDPKTLD